MRQRLMDGPYKLTTRQADNFVKRVQFAGPEECWDWTGTKRPTGYGLVKLRPHKHYANTHRVVCVSYAADTTGWKQKFACHTCDRTCCVNPKHLWLGSPKQNTADCIKKGRFAPPRGEDHPLTRLTNAQALSIYRARLAGKKLKDIAEEFNVSPDIAGYIGRGQSWKHVTNAA